MPWNLVDQGDARRGFVKACWEGRKSLTELCEDFGISRSCGHKWLRRAGQTGWLEGGRLQDRSHRTRAAEELHEQWSARVVALRRVHRHAGADQLRWYLSQKYGEEVGPGVRTIGRWLRVAGLTRKRRRRARPGPVLQSEYQTPLQPNDLWTIDFKGWFYTRDRRRVYALTVRDAATGYILLVRDMDRRPIRNILARLFRRYGLPRAIHTDNGSPFGGEGGPRGWSSLAVWWVQLGITVEYSRPGRPGDNAAHEQMHQVLQRETAQPAAPTRAAQQRRFDRWRQKYNQNRPHRTLGMSPPAWHYTPRPAPLPRLNYTYGADCELKRTDPRGRIHWRSQPRHIGRAFAQQTIALRTINADTVAVFFGPHLLGELHAHDCTGIRPVRLRHLKPAGRLSASPATPLLNQKKGGSYAPSLNPPHI